MEFSKAVARVGLERKTEGYVAKAPVAMTM